MKDSIIYVSIFGISILLGSIMRGVYVFNGYMMGVRGRKVLVAALFNKVAKLSMKSLTRTNSGKLVTLISSDLLNLERNMTMSPMIVTAILLNITCYGIMAYLFESWVYVAIVAGVWIGMIILQVYTARFIKGYAIAQAGQNDQRMKLVNDMVTGIRTIKSYGWEDHFLAKIKEIR